jgi:hypothetical protein
MVYNTDTTDNSILNCISVKRKPKTPTLKTSNGSVIVDLYEDEDIPLTFSADNFKNAAESVQSYSKAFNLPATKRNNKIFDNIFEITRYVDGTNFNPLRRTHATLKQDGIIIFEGFLRMLDISEKNGEISYNVNIYSEVTALADSLKDRTFSDLGFEELEHDYTWTNIRNSWNTSGAGITFTNSNTSGYRLSHRTLKYPFVDWNHQMVVDNGNYGTAGNPRLVNLEQAFRPWINIPYLISRIFQDSEFTYTSSVFDSNDWKYLYMDFNWGAETTGAAPIRMDFCNRTSSLNAHNIAQHPSWSTIRLSVANGGNTDLWNNSLYRFTSDVNNLSVDVSYKIVLTNKPLPGNTDDWTTTMRVCKFNQLGVVLEVFDQQDVKIDRGDSGNISGSFSTVLQNNEYIALQATTYNDDNDIQESAVTPSYLNVTYSNEASQVYTLLDSARADINQWEFLKGLMTMFNLVAIPDPDDPDNIIFETYEEIFQNISKGRTLSARNITKDWTDKIDESTIKSEILSDLSKNMVFKYAEDEDDAAFRIYKRDSAGFLYGSKEATEPDLNLLSGTEEIVAEPFAASVMKPLMPQPLYQELVTPAIYGLNDEGLTEGIDNLPRIMFNNGRKDFSSLTYYVPAQNGGSAVTAQDSYLQFSHTFHTSTSAPTSTSADINFGICPLIPPTWTPTANNLFNLYWAPYYFELYNPNTKVITLKIKLTGADIAAFKFNDHIMIKNRAYRCNRIDYKPNDLSTVELILLNFI